LFRWARGTEGRSRLAAHAHRKGIGVVVAMGSTSRMMVLAICRLIQVSPRGPIGGGDWLVLPADAERGGNGDGVERDRLPV
jgi:hypothetical protein